jgi:hypothetical protein
MIVATNVLFIFGNQADHSKQGILIEGEGSVRLTSLYYLRSAAFDIANIIYFLTKQATLMRRSIIMSLPYP